MVAPGAPEKAVLSEAEASDRIRALLSAPEDAIRFIRASNYWSFGGARPAADLRQEAMRRTVAGTRRCPRDLPMVAFLIGVMRSIASSDRRALQRAPRLSVVTSDATDAGSIGGVDPRHSPEDQIIANDRAAEIKAKILVLFENDLIAKTLAEGIMEEMEGEELRALVGLEKKAFATKRRFVRRRIDKAYPDGWKP